MAPPGTAVIGHSNGALVGARLLGRIKASAYVSLSGAWRDGHIQSEPTLRSINLPCLFTWGTGGLLDESLDGATKSFLWDPIKPPKHKLVFTDGTHFDYLSGELPCNRDGYGPCRLVSRLAANYTALFLSRHLLPPGAGIDGMIPATLMPPRAPPSR